MVVTHVMPIRLDEPPETLLCRRCARPIDGSDRVALGERLCPSCRDTAPSSVDACPEELLLR